MISGFYEDPTLGVTIIKDPTARLPYSLDWGDWIGIDTVATSTWTVPTGITKVSDTYGSKTTTIVLSGGTAGVNYVLENTITTAAGLQDSRSFTVQVKVK